MAKRTVRETLQRLHGINARHHGLCSVADYFIGKRGVEVACSCGERMLMTDDDVHAKGLTLDTVREGLRNAPRIAKS